MTLRAWVHNFFIVIIIEFLQRGPNILAYASHLVPKLFIRFLLVSQAVMKVFYF